MDDEKLFDEKLKKRINEENVIVPPELNEKINRTLHNLPVKKERLQSLYDGYKCCCPSALNCVYVGVF